MVGNPKGLDSETTQNRREPLICDTSPLQYLHQLGLLDILPNLSSGVIVPGAVVNELAEGEPLGIDLPSIQSLDWVRVEEPTNIQVLPLIVQPYVNKLQVLKFRLSAHTKAAVLKLAGED